ncbi:bifunctional diaminohydroxyphosphoribosylaminopyrimidine deaminase/5-amino-6-(5-phosphoribosylamino)uracil reductase RibD [Anaerospora sp.]|uniref:bifunctional diaminohydroxyphosphoribosylaminopyrimidine deaminase/5-amino-6-(5-phosphoribosylamino)uracil reductase RibD n=1 Tax=Anaerospora sp. TaxID=1960278 RepID=UPI0028A1CFC0|nr:bifunctional diaminohydroxyphosphoribosylaminopyrimidine deaminase/5-amino-6-(5-phosphoribosylamino)uracil reductase RibD [Anaerospora sp.]
MREALQLAQRAIGRTSPNPLVGAVIVRDGQIVGRGWHQKVGTAHAEIHALNEAGPLAAGSTIYVTLEPCSHTGRTGPCTEALIRAGIKKVVVAMTDPNPLVAGAGLELLRKAGIEVVEGVMALQAAQLNESFIKWITTGLPFIAVKAAMTLDGKIATHSGHSRWITGPEARLFVHSLRNQYDAIMVGIGTVLADDPELTTRLPEGGRNPVRIILDSEARTPLAAKVVTDGQAKTIIAVTSRAPAERMEALRKAGAEVLIVPECAQRVSLPALCKLLGSRMITSILVEGGSAIHGAIIDAKLGDKLYWFVAPKIVGGSSAPNPVGGQGVSTMEAAILIEDQAWQQVGADFLLMGHFSNREGRDVYRTCGRIG